VFAGGDGVVIDGDHALTGGLLSSTGGVSGLSVIVVSVGDGVVTDGDCALTGELLIPTGGVSGLSVTVVSFPRSPDGGSPGGGGAWDSVSDGIRSGAGGGERTSVSGSGLSFLAKSSARGTTIYTLVRAAVVPALPSASWALTTGELHLLHLG